MKDVVFDIGANVGWETNDPNMCSYHSLRPWVDHYRVVCVEPVPALCDSLRETFAGRDVTVVQAAVTDEDPESGEIDLWIPRADTMSTCDRDRIENHKKLASGHNYTWWKLQTSTTPVTRIDKLVEQHGRPVFIKIDVEGYEYRVLNTFADCYCPISFEWCEQDQNNILLSLKRCKELGYTKFWVTFGNIGICSSEMALMNRLAKCEYWGQHLWWLCQSINLVARPLTYDEVMTWMNNNTQHNRTLIIGDDDEEKDCRQTDPLWGQIYTE
jgi:FkbM family methyltransferase